MSDCPTGCGRKIDSLRYVTCWNCWRLVPSALKSEVYRAWSIRQQHRGDQNAIDAHEAAKDAAIKAAIARRT
jgi:hypothetical protein